MPKIRTCIGYGEFEGKCKNTVDEIYHKYWCVRCNILRIDTISKNLKEIKESFNPILITQCKEKGK